MEQLTFTVTTEQAGRTVKSIMLGELSMSNTLLSSLKFRPNGILKNGSQARVTDRVQPGDTLSFSIADRHENTAAPMALNIPILWEDDSFLLLNKPAGVGVYGGNRPNLAGYFASRWGNAREFHPVNRLDVGTTGLLAVAKDGYAHDRLRRLLHTDGFQREYLAVAEGIVAPDTGVVALPISRHPVNGTTRAIDPNGLPSRTEYEVLKTSENRSLLRLRLHTGRTHQIRVHMAVLGHPLVGDRQYGASDLALSHPALHSHHVRILHPLTGEIVDVTAPLPEDMAALMHSP